MLDYIFYNLISIFRAGPTSPHLSKRINELLDDENTKITIISKYKVRIGDLTLWTGYYPYCYGCEYEEMTRFTHSPIPIFLPDRKTVYRLREILSLYQSIESAFG
jgi:hypothetical protein